MDTYMHKTMGSVASLEKIEIITSQEFMPSEVGLKFLKKMIILGPKTAILGPQFCRILVLGPNFWWSGGAQAPRAPLDLPLRNIEIFVSFDACYHNHDPMTLVFKFDIDIMVTYFDTKNEVNRPNSFSCCGLETLKNGVI